MNEFGRREFDSLITLNFEKNPEYWAREEKNSNAELDYIIQKEGKIIPIEVKSGSIGRMKSMRMFMEKYQVQQGIKISQAPYDSGKKNYFVAFILS